MKRGDGCSRSTAMHTQPYIRTYTIGECYSKELKRLAAYSRSNANLLAKLTFQEEIAPYRWENQFSIAVSAAIEDGILGSEAQRS
ncbi:hypothetical protein RIF29_03841 [Crotalaria pallida]|uniref:Uncharacterized protein n=1 Tax=Crotalaria pallida TaxID=3830 RepID=A0AAN9J1D4_CROPI